MLANGPYGGSKNMEAVHRPGEREGGGLRNTCQLHRCQTRHSFQYNSITTPVAVVRSALAYFLHSRSREWPRRCGHTYRVDKYRRSLESLHHGGAHGISHQRGHGPWRFAGLERWGAGIMGRYKQQIERAEGTRSVAEGMGERERGDSAVGALRTANAKVVSSDGLAVKVGGDNALVDQAGRGKSKPSFREYDATTH